MDTSLKQQLKDNGYIGEFELSSLIEACGDGNIFQVNFPIRGKWNARKGEIHGEGSTPEMAVSKLWLELNKK